MRHAMGIASPSTITATMGADLIRGLTIGIQTGQTTFVSAIERAIQAGITQAQSKFQQFIALANASRLNSTLVSHHQELGARPRPHHRMRE
jgi:uncharacterized protein YggE